MKYKMLYCRLIIRKVQVDQDMVSQLNDGTNKYPDKYGLEHFVNWIMSHLVAVTLMILFQIDRSLHLSKVNVLAHLQCFFST